MRDVRDTTIAAARVRAVDRILLNTIGRTSPRPLYGVVTLVDRPSREHVEIRYRVPPNTHVLTTNQLVFERAPDGSLRLSPCAPRPAPPEREPGVVYTSPLGDVQTASWCFDGPVRLLDTGTIYSRA